MNVVVFYNMHSNIGGEMVCVLLKHKCTDCGIINHMIDCLKPNNGGLNTYTCSYLYKSTMETICTNIYTSIKARVFI